MFHTPHSPFRTPRPAMTLIELLVVIVILTTIVAAAIPILSPANDDRRLREATRGLNTFITGAQTRAIALKRPFGIALKRLSQDTGNTDDNGVCLEMFYVEQPAPYAGFDANSRTSVALCPESRLKQLGLALVRFDTKASPGTPKQFGLPMGILPDLIPEGLFRPGDVIEIAGTRFELLDHRLRQYGNNEAGTTMSFDENGFFRFTQQRGSPIALARPLNNSGQQINVKYDNAGREIGGFAAEPYWTPPARYRILRQAAPTSDEPYQLPEGTAIDLRASGVGRNDYFYVPGMNDNSQGVLIMFTPEGRVARVSYSQLPITNQNDESPVFDQPVVDNIFLLVGKRENIPAPAASSEPTLDLGTFSANPPKTEEQLSEIREPINWLSGNSRWIVIGSQSGRVVTVENAFVDPAAVLNDPQPPFPADPGTEEMRTRQILAAREFTREMAQLGGR
ncbi:MAG: prepilin-type N-terminal cleavage/methylation domain-containing protein [Pirellulales bacterium]